jgi:uncharacterized GH25 family protein
MKKTIILIATLFILTSHDMFLKMDTYFLKPNDFAVIKLFNGTFEKSENVITRDRMMDVSLVGNGKRTIIDTTQWSEKDSLTLLHFTSGEAGTWVAGVSTKPKQLAMKAADFNHYLEHDGVSDMLEWRKNNNSMEQDAIEEYSKHVKAIFQVGNKTTDDYKTVLGYPIEFIPMENPYETHAGHDMNIQLLWQGKPLANQLVYTGVQTHEHDHTHESAGSHTHEHDTNVTHDHEHQHDNTSGLRTDENGVVSINLPEEGIYYVRTIHLANSDREGLTHESNWATLTFEIGHGHSHDHDHNHSHDHDHESGIPMYVFVLGSILLIGGLFFWFNRKA